MHPLALSHQLNLSSLRSSSRRATLRMPNGRHVSIRRGLVRKQKRNRQCRQKGHLGPGRKSRRVHLNPSQARAEKADKTASFERTLLRGLHSTACGLLSRIQQPAHGLAFWTFSAPSSAVSAQTSWGNEAFYLLI